MIIIITITSTIIVLMVMSNILYFFFFSLFSGNKIFHIRRNTFDNLEKLALMYVVFFFFVCLCVFVVVVCLIVIHDYFQLKKFNRSFIANCHPISLVQTRCNTIENKKTATTTKQSQQSNYKTWEKSQMIKKKHFN